jgi:tRNA(adenine34) deaminase
MNESFMREALKLAHKSWAEDELPGRAIVVRDHKIIGRGYNQPILKHDPTCHAEIMAMRDAAQKLKNYRLTECDLYVTLEPCMMCLGAIFHARIKNLFFAAHDLKTGACGSMINLADSTINHHCNCQGGFLADESIHLLQNFFKSKRQKKPWTSHGFF